MSAEVVAFADLFDASIAFKSDIQNILSKTIPLQLLTDSKCLFDIVSRGSRTSEKRTMIDVASAREGFRDRDISDIGFVRSSQNIFDGLTKRMSRKALKQYMESGILTFQCEQWVVRTD